MSELSTAPTPFAGLAQQALAQYNLAGAECTYLQHSENITFQVNSPRSEVYILRIHTPLTVEMGTHGADPTVVRSELQWLESLQRNALPVPRPVRNTDGKLVTQITAEDGSALNCSMLDWIPGEIYRRDLEDEDTTAEIGLLVGKLHLHSSRWRLPRNFTRPRRDMENFKATLHALQPAVEDGRIVYADFKRMESALEYLAAITKDVRKTRSIEGLLHGDLHKGNFVYNSGEISLIDFSMCAFGNYLFDIAICLSDMKPALHPIFLVNYDRLFPLPRNYDRLIEGYFLASIIGTFSFWVNNPAAQETLVSRVPIIAQEFAARFVRDERFWFTG